MHDYKYFMLNVLANYEEKVRDTQRALKEGLKLESSEKYTAIVEEIKVQRGYERTIKMVEQDFLYIIFYQIILYLFSILED